MSLGGLFLKFYGIHTQRVQMRRVLLTNEAWWWILLIHKGYYPSCPKPQFQSEAKCKAIDTHSRGNKTHFHKKGFALSPVLKGKLFGSRRWSIAKMQALFAFLLCLIRDLTRSRFGHLTTNGKPRFAVSGFTLAVCPYLELNFSFIRWSLF